MITARGNHSGRSDGSKQKRKDRGDGEQGQSSSKRSSKWRRGNKRRRGGKFVDAVEHLPGAAAAAAAAAPPAQQAKPTESATRTTAASPVRPLPPLGASAAPSRAPSRAAVRVEVAILPSPQQPSHAAGGSKKKAAWKKRKQNKTLTAKGKRAAVLRAVAQVQPAAAAAGATQPALPAVHGAAAAPAAARPAAAAQPTMTRPPAAAVAPSRQAPAAALVAAGAPGLVGAPQAAAVAAAAPAAARPTAAQPIMARPPAAAVAPSRQAPAAGLVGAPQAAAAAAAPPVPPQFTRNLGKAWQKADITTLAKLSTDRALLQATIPDHPPGDELDWECISKHFGRYSKGGRAVQNQYNLVLRTMKEARHEGRNGANYVDLVEQALVALPNRQGTVLEVQQFLKRHNSSFLDKYRDATGALHWKKAVGEVLRRETGLFEQVGKSAAGKIVWRLKDAAAA